MNAITYVKKMTLLKIKSVVKVKCCSGSEQGKSGVTILNKHPLEKLFRKFWCGYFGLCFCFFLFFCICICCTRVGNYFCRLFTFTDMICPCIIFFIVSLFLKNRIFFIFLICITHTHFNSFMTGVRII